MLKGVVANRAVVAGIISSAIVVMLIQPAFKALWSLIQNLSAGILTGLSDKVFVNAALGHRNYIDVLLAIGIGVIILGAPIAFGLSRAILFVIFRSNDENEILAIKRKNTWLRRFLLGFYIISTIYLVLSISFLLLMFTTDVQLNTSFEQRITVIAPIISDQEEEEFRAKWASMRNRDDFEAINFEFESIAMMNEISLPKLLLK